MPPGSPRRRLRRARSPRRSARASRRPGPGPSRRATAGPGSRRPGRRRPGARRPGTANRGPSGSASCCPGRRSSSTGSRPGPGGARTSCSPTARSWRCSRRSPGDERPGAAIRRPGGRVSLPGAVLLAGGVIAAAIAADRLAARIAGAAAAASRAPEPPEVTIAGAFLPQLARGVFRRIDVRAGAFRAGGLEFSGVTASLAGVRAPLPARSGAGPVAARVTAVATIPLATLAGRLPGGLTLRAEGNTIRLAGSVLGMPVRGTLAVSAMPRALTVTPRLTGMPAIAGFVIDLAALPPGLAVSSVNVAAVGLEVRLEGREVRLGPAGPARGAEPTRRGDHPGR